MVERNAGVMAIMWSIAVWGSMTGAALEAWQLSQISCSSRSPWKKSLRSGGGRTSILALSWLPWHATYRALPLLCI